MGGVQSRTLGKCLSPRYQLVPHLAPQSQAELWGTRKGLKLLLPSCLGQYLRTQFSSQLLRLQKPGGPHPASTWFYLCKGHVVAPDGNSVRYKPRITCNLPICVCDQECPLSVSLMSVYVCCMYASVGVHLCACARGGQKTILSGKSHVPSTFGLRQGFL